MQSLMTFFHIWILWDPFVRKRKSCRAASEKWRRLARWVFCGKTSSAVRPNHPKRAIRFLPPVKKNKGVVWMYVSAEGQNIAFNQGSRRGDCWRFFWYPKDYPCSHGLQLQTTRPPPHRHFAGLSAHQTSGPPELLEVGAPQSHATHTCTGAHTHTGPTETEPDLRLYGLVSRSWDCLSDNWLLLEPVPAAGKERRRAQQVRDWEDVFDNRDLSTARLIWLQ